MRLGSEGGIHLHQAHSHARVQGTRQDGIIGDQPTMKIEGEDINVDKNSDDLQVGGRRRGI